MINKYIVSFMALFFFLEAQTSPPKSYLKSADLKGSGEIQILDFDNYLGLIEIISVRFPGEGASWVKKSDLINAADLSSNKDARLIGQLKQGNSSLRCHKIKLTELPISTFVKDKTTKGSTEDLPENTPLNPCEQK